MPLQQCSISGRRGWRWGKSGRCYTGTGARRKAVRQSIAIRRSGFVENRTRVNPLLADPSRTATLRRKFESELRKRFRWIKGALIRLIVDDNAFGLTTNSVVGGLVAGESALSPVGSPAIFQENQGERKNDQRISGRNGESSSGSVSNLRELPPADNYVYSNNLSIVAPSSVNNLRWAFRTDAKKIKAFEKWIAKRFEADIFMHAAGDTKDAYWRAFAEEGYRKGAGRAFNDVNKARRATISGSEQLAFYDGTREEFLRSSFSRPVAIAKLKQLAGRTFSDLKHSTEKIATRLRQELATGLAQGQNPITIARTLTKTLDIGRGRAQTIARTEIMRAHAEGQLDAFVDLGVTELGVMAEWDTAGDDIVCPLCEAMSGVVMTEKEMRGVIPRHQNCRCVIIPANVGEDRSKQKRGKAKIEEAIDKSIEKEIPAKGRMIKGEGRRYKSQETGKYTLKKKPSFAERKKRSDWAGADPSKTIAKDRPKDITKEPMKAPVTKPTPKPLDVSSSVTQKYPPANPKAKETLLQHTRPDGSLTPERMKLHDNIVKDAIAGSRSVQRPTAYMTGGGPASGKSVLFKKGKVKLPKNIVSIDPDELKKSIPEYADLVKKGDVRAAAFAHEESSLLSKRILAEGSEQKRNLFLDGTGDSSYASLQKKVAKMRKGGQKVKAHYVTVDTEVAVERNVARAKKTGRMVPNEYVRQVHKNISTVLPEAIDKKLFDEVVLWDTNTTDKVIKVMEHKAGKTVIHDKTLWKRFLDKADKPVSLKTPVSKSFAKKPKRPVKKAVSKDPLKFDKAKTRLSGPEPEKRFEELKKAVGKDLTREELGNLAGALDDSRVGIEGKTVVWTKGKRHHTTVVASPTSKTLHVEEIFVDKAMQGQGLGTEIVGRLVGQAKKMGYKIELSAVSGFDRDGNPLNGYYTWARLGFDGPVRKGWLRSVLLKMKKSGESKSVVDAMRKVEKVSDLMKTERGRKIWKESGETIDLAMPTDSGSKELAVFKDYLKKKRGL